MDNWILSNPDDFTTWFFAVYNMYIWTEEWNNAMMCLPRSEELHSLLKKRWKTFVMWDRTINGIDEVDIMDNSNSKVDKPTKIELINKSCSSVTRS